MSAVPTARRRLRLAGAWLLGIVVLAIAVLVAGAPAEDRPLDPTATGPNGLRGVVDLLEGLGVAVTVSLEPPTDTDTRVFVPVDLLGSERREALLEWVEAGGTLVVAGADARLNGLVPAGAGITDRVGPTGRAPDCAPAALGSVGEVVHDDWAGMRVPEESNEVTTCFGEEEVAWLIARPQGDGVVIAIGSAAPFVNARLDEADNAVLAVSLLGPTSGSRLSIVPRPPVGEGDTPMTELIADRVWHALGLLLAAVLLGVLWRGRRFGRPVPEALPPVIPAAELTRSIAELTHRAGSRQGAADRLRATARATLARTLGVPSSAAALTELAEARLGIDRATVQQALIDAPVDDDQALLAAARAVRHVETACRHGWTRSNGLSINRYTDSSVEQPTDRELGVSR